MGLFRDCILYNSSPSTPTSVAGVLHAVILEQVRMERDGDIIDQSLVRSCAYMLEGLYETDEEEESTKLYLTDFEPVFLKASQEFYRAESLMLLQTGDAATYCHHTKRRLREESDRCRSTLSTLTLPKITKVIEQELISNRIQEVIDLPNTGAKSMFEESKVGSLKQLYELISRVDPQKKHLKIALQQKIVEKGTEINQEASSTQPKTGAQPETEGGNDKDGNAHAATAKAALQPANAALDWVDKVLNLKTKYDNIISQAFLDDQELKTALSRSFTEFINAFPRSSEHLSLFFDENMRKGIKNKTENEVDQLLENGITLLRFVQDKDMFEGYYKKHLSKRLLLKRSISMDAERQMISKMKLEVGNTFTQRLEAMFKDIAVSEDLSAGFQKHVRSLDHGSDAIPAELDVHVLTSTMWPLENMSQAALDPDQIAKTCILPPNIDTLKQQFERFYLNKHSGRQLKWQTQMGSADVRAYFSGAKSKNKHRELNVSTHAMAILLLFNDLPSDASLSAEEIQARTNIPHDDLNRNLQSLAVAPKTRILLKEPMSREIASTDRFSFNEGFTSQFVKIKIGVVSSANKIEDTEQRRQSEKKISDDRGHLIEACVVRIMKQRKELTHTVLVSEVLSQLMGRFQPDVTMIKKKIESLIEREYLERMDDIDRAKYRYLA
ncbi:Cullin-3 [Agyrium rufum]|nr:Cullin-3 [Agyrium rufum]